jgi:cytochrome c5
MERKTTMNLRHLLVPIIVLFALPLVPAAAFQTEPAAPQAGKKPTPAVHAPQHSGDDGERIFQQQCSRCHNAPEGFSPRLSGTIVRHMRVRASLSRHEEEELLRYFNP